jgi:hypothetical protein
VDPRPTTERKIKENYSVRESDEHYRWDYFEHRRIFECASRFLIEKGLIEIISDEFGPPIISISQDFYNLWEKLQKDRQYPFYKYALAGDGDGWVHEALQALDREYNSLEITDEDFDAPPEQEWEPLPIDRRDPNLKAVIDKIDETYEQVRSDNGYAAHVPEERAYVLDSLGLAVSKLKEASTISFPYLRRYAIEQRSSRCPR